MAEKTVQLNTKLVTAHAKSLHVSPRKMRLVTNLVNGMRVADALTQLQFTNKKAAPMVTKLLKSAVANAEHNFSLNADDLFVKSITCDMGKTLRRYFPRARGSAFIVRKKMCHVHVVLEERAGKKPKASRLALLRRTRTATSPKKETGAVTETTVEQSGSESHLEKKSFKPEEQIKMNRVQQKRRLFNRKSGE